MSAVNTIRQKSNANAKYVLLVCMLVRLLAYQFVCLPDCSNVKILKKASLLSKQKHISVCLYINWKTQQQKKRKSFTQLVAVADRR